MDKGVDLVDVRTFGGYYSRNVLQNEFIYTGYERLLSNKRGITLAG